MGKGPNNSDGAKEGYTVRRDGKKIQTVKCACCDRQVPLDPRDDPITEGVGEALDALFKPKASSLEGHVVHPNLNKRLFAGIFNKIRTGNVQQDTNDFRRGKSPSRRSK